jgi:hypothetical protein
MPYIEENKRELLNDSIHNMIMTLKTATFAPVVGHILPDSGDIKDYYKLNNEEFLSVLGDINYVFSRVIMGVMGDVSYGKIAMATGVLENIKQELYRRAASGYEDKKILSNGDIPEYKKLK